MSLTETSAHLVGDRSPDGLLADILHGPEHVVEHAVGLTAKFSPVLGIEGGARGGHFRVGGTAFGVAIAQVFDSSEIF
jgi:hypothetical protein